MADVVSFNTLIKVHLQSNNINKAHELMEEMQKLGLQPNSVTFNELINAMVAAGRSREDVWQVVAEMKKAGIKTNHVTCSILLKTLNYRSSERDVKQTMALVETMEEPMDEILLSSVLEACVRIGKKDCLTAKLEAIQGSGRVEITGSHTFGSLIKAYGHSRDLDGVWRCWKDMRNRHITPTSITMQPMVMLVGVMCLLRMSFQQRHTPSKSREWPYALIKLPKVWEPVISTRPLPWIASNFAVNKSGLPMRTHASTTEDKRISSIGSSMVSTSAMVCLTSLSGERAFNVFRRIEHVTWLVLMPAFFISATTCQTSSRLRPAATMALMSSLKVTLLGCKLNFCISSINSYALSMLLLCK